MNWLAFKIAGCKSIYANCFIKHFVRRVVYSFVIFGLWAVNQMANAAVHTYTAGGWLLHFLIQTSLSASEN